MCVIFQQLPGYTLPYDKLYNAVHNNSHGYGILVKTSNRIELHKDLPEDGNDPEQIYKILKDNEDAERWVHVRNKTQGDISADNTQPFEVYSSNHQRIFFMHNGTLSSDIVNPPDEVKELLKAIDDEVDPATASDSRKFAFWRLQPLLLRLNGEKGPADLTDPFVQETIRKFWPMHSNRGVLISSLDDVQLILNRQSWSTIIIDGKPAFLASNNDYFDRLTRGPLFEKQKEEEEKKRRETATRTAVNRGVPQSPLEGLTALTSPPFSKRFGISEHVSDLLDDYNIYTPEGMIGLSAMTYDETYDLFKKHPTDATILFMQITTMLSDMKNEVDALEEDKKKAESLIRKLKKKLHAETRKSDTETVAKETVQHDGATEAVHG